MVSHKNKKKKTFSQPLTFIERLDKYIEPRLNLVLIVSLFFTVFFGAFLFDVKISTGGDDSSYIEMANNFLKGNSFPTWHGPLYSIFLTLPVLLFGVDVIMLKLFSFVFIIGHIVFFFYTFKRNFSPALLSLIMLILSVDSTILYFASQTYSEAMFMFLQSLTVMVFLKMYLLSETNEALYLKQQARWIVMLGFLIFLTSLAKNIGIVIWLSILLFLTLQKSYRMSLYIAGSFLVFFIPFMIYRKLVWETGTGGVTGQFSEILLKNSYNQAEGYENFGGMVMRFFENARLYFSKHFMIGIGLHDPVSTDKSWFVTLIVAGLLIMAFVYAMKRDKVMSFISIYLGGALAATFIALQTTWDQMRMVVIYIPMMLVAISWGLLQLSTRKGYGFLQVVLVGLLLLVFFKTMGQTLEKTKQNRDVLVQNLNGNMYYGFTPDWQNYLKMSEWVGENLPEDVTVASRKPSMSFIYSKGKDFYGIYRLPTEDPADLIRQIQEKDASSLVAIPGNELQEQTAEVQMRIRSNVAAFVADGETLYGIYRDTETFTEMLEQYADLQVIHRMPVDSLLDVLNGSDRSPYAVSPDSMLLELRENHVDYVIMANLRAIPTEKTGRTINTVQRYLYFIQQKYPGIFTLQQQIGAENDEPAWLYKINYDAYGL